MCLSDIFCAIGNILDGEWTSKTDCAGNTFEVWTKKIPIPKVTFIEDAPITLTDFSMFPDEIAPTTGQYQAWTDNFVYTIKGGETSWQQSARSN